MQDEGNPFEQEPTFDELMALLSGELEGSRRSEIRAYLRRDPEMLRAALDCFDSESLESASGLEPEDADRAWQRFEGEILVTAAADASPEDSGLSGLEDFGPANEALFPEPPVEPMLLGKDGVEAPDARGRASTPPAPATFFRQLVLRDLIAASFGAAAMLFLVLSQGSSQSSVVFEEIRPRDEQRTTRGTGSRIVLELAKDTDQLALALVPPSTLEIEIPPVVTYSLESNGRTIEEGSLRQQDEGTFFLLVATNKVPPGVYEVRLRGRDGSRFDALYELEIEQGEPHAAPSGSGRPESAATSS